MRVVRVVCGDEIDRSKYVNIDHVKMIYFNADGSDRIQTIDGEWFFCHNGRFAIEELK